jgi:hypothetical protein
MRADDEMKLGIDFDNTIVSYDSVFHRVALEQGLIAPDVPATKAAVRQALRDQGCEENWIEMQGYVYGARMLDAEPFPGVLEFFRRALADGRDIAIISHKTRHPYRGPSYDLHQAAHGWLEQQGFYDPARIGLGRDRVYFELTKSAKLDRIAQFGCTHFIDDLPEILDDPGFPRPVVRLLFDPAGHCGHKSDVARFATWNELEQELSGREVIA